MNETPTVYDLRPLKLALYTALGWGLSLGWLDLVRGATTQKIHPESPLVLLGSLTLVFVLVGAAVLLAAGTLGTLLIRMTPLGSSAVLLGIGALVGVPFLLRIVGFERAIPEWRQWGTFWLPALVAASSFTMTLLAAHGGASNRRTVDLGFRLGLVAPLVLAETFLLYWARQELLHGFLTRAAGWLVWVAVVTCTIWLFGRRGRIGVVGGALGVLALITFLATAAAWAVEQRSPGYPPHRHDGPVRRVVLVTIDTLRTDALSIYGAANPTPRLELLAADSVVFDNAHSPSPWTLPAFVSLMSGISPWAHGVRHVDERPSEGLPLLARRLGNVGYLTGAIGYNYFLTPHYTKGTLSAGFDHYDFYPRRHRPETFGVWLVDRLRSSPGDTDDLTRRAQSWVREHADQDFFLWLHYYDPHAKYAPPPEFYPQGEPDPRIGAEFGDEQEIDRIREGVLRPDARMLDWTRRLYDAEVRYVDDRLGRFLTTLQELSLYDDTLIVVTSDHGEEIFDHGSIDHGHTLYQELLRVPLMVKLPGSSEGRRLGQVVSTEDLVPTLLELVGIPFDEAEFSGRTLAPLWREGGSDLPDERVFSTGMLIFDDRRSVIFDGYKYIRFDDWPREELYDLENDPAERRNLAEQRPDLVAAGRELLEVWGTRNTELRRSHGLDEGQTFDLDDSEREFLRSLGYVN